MTSTTPAAPVAPDDDGQDFEAEFHDGPPAAGVAIVLGIFMAGMALGAYLEWLR
jgi:hypothetical protein